MTAAASARRRLSLCEMCASMNVCVSVTKPSRSARICKSRFACWLQLAKLADGGRRFVRTETTTPAAMHSDTPTSLSRHKCRSLRSVTRAAVNCDDESASQ